MSAEPYREAATYEELCARLPASTRAHIAAKVAAAPPLSPETIAILKPVFAGAMERIARRDTAA